MNVRTDRRPGQAVALALALALAAAGTPAESPAQAAAHTPSEDGTAQDRTSQDGPAGFVLSGAFGGAVVDLASRGGRTVALVGQRLEVLDAQAASMEGGTLHLLAVSPPLPGLPGNVALSDDGATAYVAAGIGGVHVVDVAVAPDAPGGPSIAPIVARLAPPPPGEPSDVLDGTVDVAVAGATLYTVGQRQLDLYDIAAPDRPAALSSLDLDDDFYAVAAADWGAALLGIPAGGATNVRLVDAADRRRPLLAGSAGVELGGGSPGDIAVQERRVIVFNEGASAWVDATLPFVPRVRVLPLGLHDLDIAPDRPDEAVAIGHDVPGGSTSSSELVWLDLTDPATPRRLAQTDVGRDVRHVALVDAAARAAIADDPSGLALLRPDRDGALVRADVAERFGLVQNATSLDREHVVALGLKRLTVLRRSDGATVAEAQLDLTAGIAAWYDVVTDQGWGYVSGVTGGAYSLTPIDMRVPTAPVVHEPVLVGSQAITALRAAPGWMAMLNRSMVSIWSTSGDGLGADRRDIVLSRAESGPSSIALTPRSLVVSDARGVRALDLADLSRERALIAQPTDAAGLPWDVVAASDGWLLTYRLPEGLTVHSVDGTANPPHLVDRTRDFDRAFIDGDRAVALGQGIVGAEPGRPAAPEIAAIDLAAGAVVARTAVGYSSRLANVGPGGGPAEAGMVSITGALQMWREVGALPPTQTPFPSATHPAPTHAPPPAGPTIYLPYAVAFRAAAKPPLTLRPTARIGGVADAVVVDGAVAWLRERGRLTGVDIGGDVLRPLGSVDVCASGDCTLEPFAVSGGRLALNDGAGGVRIVDVTDPLRPRRGGRIVDDSGRYPGFAVAAPWPGRPLFLLARHVDDPAAEWNDEATELRVVDATEAGAPRTVRALRRLEPIGPIVAANGLVYAVGFRKDDVTVGEVQVWSLAEDGELSVVGRASAAGGLASAIADGRASAVANASRLFVAAGDYSIAAFDLADPRRPMAIQPPDLHDAVDTANAFLSVFDVSAVQALGSTLVATLPDVRAIVVAPPADAEADGAVLDVPVLHDRAYDGRSRAGAMAVAGDRLVVAGGAYGGLTVIDGLLEPDRKPRWRTLHSVGAVRGLARAGATGSALLASGASADELHRIDLAAPERVTLSDRAMADVEPNEGQGWGWYPDVDLAVEGAAVWAAGTQFVLTGFDLGSAEGPRAVPNSGRTEGLGFGSGRMGVALMADASFAVTAHALRGVEVWDVSERSGPPPAVARFSTGGAPEDIVLDGRRAFVADGQGGVAVLDLRNPAAPREVGRLPLPGSAVRVAFDGARSELWLALEQRDGSRWPMTGIGGGRFPSAVAAVAVGPDGALRLRGVVGLPAARVRDIALHADRVVVSGALDDGPGTSPTDVVSYQQTNVLLVLDADPAAPSIRGTWSDLPHSRASGGLAVLADGRVALAAGEDGLRVFEVDEGGR